MIKIGENKWRYEVGDILVYGDRYIGLVQKVDTCNHTACLIYDPIDGVPVLHNFSQETKCRTATSSEKVLYGEFLQNIVSVKMMPYEEEGNL